VLQVFFNAKKENKKKWAIETSASIGHQREVAKLPIGRQAP
jgi:hypothetical protein